MSAPGATPERILQLVTGGWACAIVGAAVTHSVFTHLDRGATTAGAMADKAGISLRGAQALLDGLTGLGLIHLQDGVYRNSDDASAYLVEGRPSYMGALARTNLADLAEWARFAEVTRSGMPAAHADPADNPFWEQLVLGIAPMAFPVAQLAAERLGVAQAGPVSVLDVGGGSGAYSAVWLSANPHAVATQIDWSNVNGVARQFVAKFGVGDRFRTVDGDFHAVDFGVAEYDYGIYSHIAHGEAPEQNVVTFKRFRKALKPGGTLLVVDFVVNDDRTGPPFALLFHSNMLLRTSGGATWREADYRRWLSEAGFSNISLQATPTPGTLVYAR